MKTFGKVLLTGLAMAAVAGSALGIYKLTELSKERKWEEERTVRLLTINESADEIRTEIEELSQLSVEEIESYLNEHTFTDEEDEDDDGNVIDAWAAPDETAAEEGTPTEEAADGENDGPTAEPSDEDNVNAASADDADAGAEGHTDGITDDILSEEPTVSENSLSDEGEEGSVSDNDLAEETVSGNDVSGNTVSGNQTLDGTVSGNTIVTLKDRQKLRASYEETTLWAEADERVLTDYAQEFAGKKIACLGDSITAAANLTELENYISLSYPTRLSELFDTESPVNLGIGGSSLGRYWDMAFCDRYQEIPEDTEVILVMGGTNDGFCLTEDLVGNTEERAPRTLYGDVNDLMKGLSESYPDAEIYVMTPLPNVLHDILRKERENLLPQTVVVDCVRELAQEYGFTVIDLYNANFLDSHDAAIVSGYVPDGVHPNADGYELLAQHIAAEILRSREVTESGNTLAEEGENVQTTVSGNHTVSGNAADSEEQGSKTVIYSREDPTDGDSDVEGDDENDSGNDDTDADSAEKEEKSTSQTEETTSDNDKNESNTNSEATPKPTSAPTASPGSKTVIYSRDN